MPVTANLSRKFYETFGDELANGSWSGSTKWTLRTDPTSGT